MLTSVEQVIDAVGGSQEAAKLARVGVTAVSNWKHRKRIPPEWSLVFSDFLARRGEEIAPSVFGLRLVDEEDVA